MTKLKTSQIIRCGMRFADLEAFKAHTEKRLAAIENAAAEHETKLRHLKALFGCASTAASPNTNKEAIHEDGG